MHNHLLAGSSTRPEGHRRENARGQLIRLQGIERQAIAELPSPILAMSQPGLRGISAIYLYVMIQGSLTCP